MGDSSVIHLNVDRQTKGRWVRASRAAGVKLTDYIENAVEAYMKHQLTTVAIPDDVNFDDLQLTMDADGYISFNTDVIAQICRASGVDIRVFEDGPEGNLSEFINTWYRAHQSNGGEKHPVMEAMISEVEIEDLHGQHVSHGAGRA